MTNIERFETGKEFFWLGRAFEVRKLLPGSNVEILNLRTGETETHPFPYLLKALFDGALWFGGDGRSADHSIKEGYIDLSDSPKALRAIADYRKEVILPLLDLPRSKRHAAIRARVKEYKEKHQDVGSTMLTAISETSVYRWLADYTRSGGDDCSLIPNTEKRGGRDHRLRDEVENIIRVVIEEFQSVGEVRTIKYIRNEIAVRINEANKLRPEWDWLKMPSKATIGRRLAEMDVEGKLVPRRARGGERKKSKQHGKTKYPYIPLERVEIDHTRTDIIVIDEDDFLPLGRLTLTYCLDMATRYPLGYYLGFEPPSYYTVMECLYHTICPKGDVHELYGTDHEWIACGIPYTLIIDNGKEFIGKDLRDVCSILGIILQRTPVKTPHFKAGVERMFGTINTGLLHMLPGTTFSNPGQRGDYNSVKQACIGLDDLDRIVHIYLLDIYAQDFHRGLNGIPADCWAEATRGGFFPRVPPSADELRILLGRVEYRTIRASGIEFETLRYNSPELTPLRTKMSKQDDKQVKFKYHPGDLGAIWVYDPFDRRYIEVPAVGQEYASGLSLWKHRVIRSFVLAEEGKVDIVALGRAQRKIQEIVAESMAAKKSGLRSLEARWKTGGRGPNRGTEAAQQPAIAQEPDALSSGEIEGVPALPAPNIILDTNLDELQAEGWGYSYDLGEEQRNDED